MPGPWASTAHAETMPRAQEWCWETPPPLQPLPPTSCIILGLLLSQRATPCPQGAPAARAPHPTHPPGHSSLSRKQQLSTLLKKKKAWISAWTTEIETRSDSGTVPQQPQCSLEPSAMAVPRCCQLSLSSCARLNGWMQQRGALLQKTFELCFQGQETEKNKEQKKYALGQTLL